MTEFRGLADDFFVAGQVTQQDLRRARDVGVTLVVNNRLDGETPGQPTGEQAAAWAAEAGLDYRAIPIRGGGLEAESIAALSEARAAAAGGAVLAYCYSGMRSAALWAMQSVSDGETRAADALTRAAEAGFDLTVLAGALSAIEAQREPITHEGTGS